LPTIVILKDVKVKETAKVLESVMGPLMPFPCSIQVVPDKIVAFEQVLMQDYSVIVLPFRCTDIFTNSNFSKVLESAGGKAPKFIYMVENDDYISRCPIAGSVLRLSPDSSIPVHALVHLLTIAIVPREVIEVAEAIVPIFFEAASTSLPVPFQQPIQAAMPCESPSPAKRGSCKRKRNRECAAQGAGDITSRQPRTAESSSGKKRHTERRESHTGEYMQYWNTVHAQQQLLAHQYAMLYSPPEPFPLAPVPDGSSHRAYDAALADLASLSVYDDDTDSQSSGSLPDSFAGGDYFGDFAFEAGAISEAVQPSTAVK
jgi:hypothetical protein